MDLILSQFNLDSPLPTFFEMRAQEELMPVLGGAFRYGLTVTAQRVIPLSKILPYCDEIFAAVWAGLDYKFLTAIDSTFSEHFYGITRVIAPPHADITRDLEEGKVQAYPRLSRRDRLLSVLASVLVPYIKRKLTELMRKIRDDEEQPEESRVYKDAWCRVFAAVYPYIHLVVEGMTAVYWLRYLFESPWWSAFLHSRRILLRRLEMADYNALQGSKHITFLERTGQVILWMIVGFRVLEWWNSTETSRQDDSTGGTGDAPGTDPTALVPPPPPPPEVESIRGDASSDCHLCRHTITNPTLNAASGLVYCYPCIHQFVEANAEDPVTKQHTTLYHLRRVYETSG